MIDLFKRKRSRRDASPVPAPSRPGGAARRFCADQRGGVAILAAVMFPVVVGALGLGVESSFWYMTQRKLQHAADQSSHAAGVRNRAGDTQSEIQAAALTVATASGFIPSSGTITVRKPPATGSRVGDTDSVEVILTENRPRWFSSVFRKEPVTIRARAVSRIGGGSPACVLALSPTAGGAVTVTGSTSVLLNNCDVASNSVASNSFLMSGTGAALNTGCVYAVGQAAVSSGLSLSVCPSVKVNAPITRDPYANVAEPVVTGACQSRAVGHPVQPVTITPTDNHPSGVKSRRYCNGIDIKGNVTFQPGLYIIEGGTFTANGGDPNSVSLSQVSGNGVTFYLTKTASLQLAGNVNLNLSAPTSGPWSGILFFGARDATSVNNLINGTATSTLQGAIYTPASAIQYRGNSTATNGCTQVIGRTVTLSGNSSIRSNCQSAGTRTIVANEGVSVVE